jgi:adenosylhomocysteine nucleosidase
MILILGAMDIEIDGLKSHMNHLEHHDYPRPHMTGTIFNHEVVLTKCGIGKVNAALSVQILLSKYDITKIINIGVAAGMPGVRPLDMVIATNTAYHDVDVTSFDRYLKGQLPGLPLMFDVDSSDVKDLQDICLQKNIPFHKGVIVTGDQFVTSLKDVGITLANQKAVDMESAAIGHCAHINQIPYVILRSISDELESTKTNAEAFEVFAKKAADRSIEIIMSYLELQQSI